MRGAVWYYDRSDGIEELNLIKANYEKINIKPIHIVQNLSEYIIEFENGDFWRLIHAASNARGYKINISYIDYRIDKEIVDCIIKPCTVSYPYQAFKIYYPK